MSTVPEQEKGKSVDLEHSITYPTESQAVEAFKRAADRLLHPETWKGITGKLAAEFSPVENSGPYSPVDINDHIEITMPGPGNKTGDGSDWVKVRDIKKEIEPGRESIALTLEVTSNPSQPEKGVAHFFEDGATSTFIIARTDNIVVAKYCGRNERPNTDNPDLADKIRNTIVAIGAMVGLSELHWKKLLKGLLEE